MALRQFMRRVWHRTRTAARDPRWPPEHLLDVSRMLLARPELRGWSYERLAPFITAMMNGDTCAFFQRAFGYLYGSGISGDYHEYGCYSARTFRMALSEAHKWQLDSMRLYAFDSFAGLPAPTSSPDVASWTEGAMAMSADQFRAVVSALGLGLDRVAITEGFFNETLTLALQRRLLDEGRTIAFCNIDCDLRESAESVFAFVAPLIKDGTLIYLDDFFVGYGGRLRDGVAGAYWRFLEEHHWKAEPFATVGFWGKAVVLYR
jgi:hypothetical protein